MKTNTLQLERPSLFSMTWPIFIELSLQMLVGNIDQFMVSKIPGHAVPAIGNANQIISVIILTFSIISMATSILVSQYLGANNREKLSEIYTLSISVNAGFGLIISAFLFFCSDLIFKWMRIPPEIENDFISYLSIVGGFMFLQAVFMTFSAIFKCNALMKDTMFLAVIINIVNVIGNWLLIFGIGPFPELGITGAAISTAFSKLVGLILIIIFYNKKVGVSLSLGNLKPFPVNSFKKLLYIGLPSGGEGISYDFTQVVIMIFVNMLGTAVITTKTLGFMFAMVACIFAMALANATQVLVGYLIGAKEFNDADKQVWKSLFMSIVISVGITVLLYIFSDFIFGLFSNDPEVLLLGKKIMFVEIFLEIGRATNITMVRSLQATGDVRFPVILGITSNWAIAVALSYVFGIVLGWGLVGIWIAMASDEIIRGIIFIFRWRSGIWKNKSLIGN